MAETRMDPLEEGVDLPHNVAGHKVAAPLEGWQPNVLLFETHYIWASGVDEVYLFVRCSQSHSLRYTLWLDNRGVETGLSTKSSTV